METLQSVRRVEAGEPTLIYDLVNPLHPLSDELISFQATEGLSQLLADAEVDAPLPARVAWLEELGRWLTTPVRDRSSGVSAPGPGRLRFLLQVMRLYPTWRQTVGGVLVSVLRDLRALELFAEAGLPTEPGLFSEAAARVARSVLPRLRRNHELSDLLEHLFPTAAEAAWLEALPVELVEQLLTQLNGLLHPEGPAVRTLQLELAEAVAILGLRAAARAMAPDARALGVAAGLRELPFAGLATASEALAQAVRVAPGDRLVLAGSVARCCRAVAACRAASEQLLAQAEHSSAGLGLLFGLELGLQRLERIEALLETLLAPAGTARAVRGLLARLVRDRLRSRSVAGLASRPSVRRLGARVADTVGRTGEHYISHTPEEEHQAFSAGAGGGLLTAGTTILKVLIGTLALPLFPEGVLVAMNYAGSFLLMQLCGYALATKQTAFTAAALARAVRAGAEAQPARVLARIVRSQLVVAAANVGAVVPAALAFNVVYRWVTGHSFLSVEQADHVLTSLNPLQSGTVPYAAVTGIFLWLSGVAGGAFESWARYKRLPEALEAHARGHGGRLLRALARNLPGSGGAVALGMMMGLAPQLARFLGLPLEVRHVTLSSGSLALAGAALGPQAALEHGLLAAASGIACIAVMNLGVGFLAGLLWSLRSHGLRNPGSVGQLLRSALRGPPERA